MQSSEGFARSCFCFFSYSSVGSGKEMHPYSMTLIRQILRTEAAAEGERSAMAMGEGEAVVACSDQSMKIGASMWDLETGEKLLHIPSCASPPLGFLCLRNRFLVASQVNRHGSVGDGTIAVWSLNKPQHPLLNYTVEAIGALSCTNDGIYLVGGALSGNAYLWDVISGKLLKTWKAHNKSLNCMLFSHDNSLLISSSDDGMICVWDFLSGKHIQTQVYPLAITSIALHQSESLLFCGTEKATIFVNNLDFGRGEGPFVVTEGQPLELKGHNGAITALTVSRSCLISASEDCSICVWDIFSWEILRRFSLQKERCTYSHNHADESGNKYRESCMGNKHDKACHGDKQTIEVTTIRLDAT
ncbi:unnamed protein product [Sphenostylis stenocarpa]|uniref:Uncharacterized protein n=1 Tax=Sphenostylis stenocarpa TaxID=92480 RepID=A0AA86SYQ2_9FABA|nr:unnamed protein product [Sphenostylis stenocarpa]